jgi:hypothetical protein
MTINILDVLPDEIHCRFLSFLPESKDVKNARLVCKKFQENMDAVFYLRCRCLHSAGHELYQQLRQAKPIFSNIEFEQQLAFFDGCIQNLIHGKLSKLFANFKEETINMFCNLRNDEIEHLSLPNCIRKSPDVFLDDLMDKIQNRIIGTLSINLLEAPKVDAQTRAIVVPVQILSKRCTQCAIDLMNDPKSILFDRYFLGERLLCKQEESTLIFKSKGKEFQFFCLQNLGANNQESFNGAIEKVFRTYSPQSEDLFNPPISQDEQKSMIRAFERKYLNSIGKS